jgi:hypothetical protein
MSEPNKKQKTNETCAPSEVGVALDIEVTFGKLISDASGLVPGRIQVRSKPGFKLDLSGQGDTPLFVAIMDRSGSMTYHGRWGAAKKALKYFVHMANQQRQRLSLAIVAFSDDAEVLMEPTLNPSAEALEAALEGVRPSGGTMFDWALHKALEVSATAFAEKRPVVFGFFTDGQDTSTLRDEMKAFREKGHCTELLCGLQRQERFRMHTVGIGRLASSEILKELATFPTQAGECVVVGDQDMPKVMGALFATLLEVVPDACTVRVGESVIPIEVQVGDPTVSSQVSFLVPAVGPVRVALLVGAQCVFEHLVEEAVVQTVQEEHFLRDALRFVCPTLLRDIAGDLKQRKLDEALERVTAAMATMRTVSAVEPVDEVLGDLSALTRAIEDMKEDGRQASEALTCVSRMQSQASSLVRSLTGAPSLLEEDGRPMSFSARTFSQESQAF